MNDLYAQFQQIKKMGPLKKVLGMIPGMEQQLRDVEIDDRQMLRVEAIITSMSKAERANPGIINPSRKRRIAAGSGTTVEEVNRLLKQYEQMKKMFRQMTKTGKNGRKMRGLGMPGGMGGRFPKR